MSIIVSSAFDSGNIRLVKADGPELASIRNAASRTLAHFTRETATEALSELANVVADRSYSQRTGPKPSLGWKHELRSRPSSIAAATSASTPRRST